MGSSDSPGYIDWDLDFSDAPDEVLPSEDELFKGFAKVFGKRDDQDGNNSQGKDNDQTIYVLGPTKGTYGYKACQQVAPGHQHIDHTSRSNAEVITKMVRRRAIGIVPVMNSHKGYVSDAIAQLIENQKGIWVVGSTDVVVEHNLCTKPEWVDTEPKDIYSHKQAIGQCRPNLDKLYPTARCNHVGSTAGGSDYLDEAGDYVICSRDAAQENGLKIMNDKIGPENNTTTFLVLSVSKKVEVQFSGLHHNLTVGSVRYDGIALPPQQREELIRHLGNYGELCSLTDRIPSSTKSEHIFVVRRNDDTPAPEEQTGPRGFQMQGIGKPEIRLLRTMDAPTS